MFNPRNLTLLFFIALAGIGLVGCSSEVTIGAVVSAEGPAAIYGEKVRNGLDLALDEINAETINGKTVRLVYRDDKSQPDVGAAAAQELIDQEGVNIIVGGLISEVAMAIAPVVEKEQVILLSPSASAPEITDAGEYVYRNYPSDILEGTSMAEFASDLGLEQVVVFSAKNNFGVGLKKVFTQRFENNYRSVVGAFEFDETASVDELRAMVEEAKALNPEGIYIIAYLNKTSDILLAIKEAGIEAVMMGTGAVTTDLPRNAGDSAELLVYPQPPFDLDSQEDVVRSFVEAYRSRYGTDPDTYAAHGYDALKILAAAIGDAGTSHSGEIKSALARMSGFKGASGDTSFDKNGDVVQFPRLFIIKDGASTPYRKFIEDGGSLTIPNRG